MRLLLAHAPEPLIPCIALGAFAGIRNIELVRMAWSAIHFPAEDPAPNPEPGEDAEPQKYPHGYIIIEKSVAKRHRTAARRTIPMSKNLLSWLLPYRLKSGPIAHTRFDEKLSAAITAAIREINTSQQKSRRPLIGRPKNGLRHSYGTYRLPVLIDVPALSIEMNNSPREIEKCYDGHALPKDVKEWWRIARQDTSQILLFEQSA